MLRKAARYVFLIIFLREVIGLSMIVFCPLKWQKEVVLTAAIHIIPNPKPNKKNYCNL